MITIITNYYYAIILKIMFETNNKHINNWYIDRPN